MEPDKEAENQEQTTEVTFVDDGGRPKVKKYTHEPKFRPNDYVYLQTSGSSTREGPYIVAYVKDNKYTLCNARGDIIKDGNTFKEKDLELQDPFE